MRKKSVKTGIKTGRDNFLIRAAKQTRLFRKTHCYLIVLSKVLKTKRFLSYFITKNILRKPPFIIIY
ncbi:MAG: hypothetical protein DBY09_05860 [Selenomonadales bacterium]|nr:MAG: hypothetical protein DBY09_05860 [Selenomonadales bacterium]